MKRTRYALGTLFACSALLLAACGGTDTEAEAPGGGLAEFENQEVVWESCDPIFDAEFNELLAPLGDRLECATLQTALDWDEPERDTINLGVLRVKAGDEAAREGAIFLNPGGPGGDGLEIGALFGLVFANGSFEEIGYPTAAPDLLTQISERYDVIGFSPRGLGGSFQLFCGSNLTLPPANFYTDRSEENVRILLEQGRVIAETCLNNPLSSYIDTEQTARDMDLVRRLLGDEKLNFLGYSYGSWLGAWYAKLFPEHTGNMVLDANVEFSTDWQETDFDFVMGFQRAFEEVALPYAARNSAFYGLGDTAEEVYSVYDSLERDLKGALVRGRLSIVGDLYRSDNVTSIAGKLLVARGVQEVLDEFGPVTSDNAESFFAQLEAYTYIEDEELDIQAKEAALILGEDYLELLEFGFTRASKDVIRRTGSAVNTAVVCNDSPFNRDPEFWIQKGDELNELYPLLGGSLTAQPCAFWDEPSTSMSDVPSSIPPILMVQTGFDAATPSEGAVRAFETLPGARLVYVENEMSHAIFPYNTSCVDERVAAYLLDGTLPEEDVTSCDAKPLPGETQVYAPGGVPSFGAQGLSTQAAETYEPNPLYDLIHERIRENAADFFGHSARERN